MLSLSSVLGDFRAPFAAASESDSGGIWSLKHRAEIPGPVATQRCGMAVTCQADL